MGSVSPGREHQREEGWASAGSSERVPTGSKPLATTSGPGPHPIRALPTNLAIHRTGLLGVWGLTLGLIFCSILKFLILNKGALHFDCARDPTYYIQLVPPISIINYM